MRALLRRVQNWFRQGDGSESAKWSWLRLPYWLFLGAVLVSLVKSFGSDYYAFSQIKVIVETPTPWTTEEEMTWDIRQHLAEMRRIGWSQQGLSINADPEEAVLDGVEVFGVSLNAIRFFVRELFGMDKKQITGRLVIAEGHALYRFSISGKALIHRRYPISESGFDWESYQRVIGDITSDIMRQLDPFGLVSYLWAKQEYQACIDEIRTMLPHLERDLVAQAYVIWGEILYQQRYFHQAQTKFMLAVEYDAELAIAHYGVGRAHLALERSQEASEAFATALEQDPELWDAWYSWGRALSRAGAVELAMVRLQKAIEIDPHRPEAFNELSYLLMSNNQQQQAITLMEQAIAANPHSGLLNATLAEHYWVVRQPNRALSQLRLAEAKGFDIKAYRDFEPYRSYFSSVKRSEERPKF